jgi:hypothetical protein
MEVFIKLGVLFGCLFTSALFVVMVGCILVLILLQWPIWRDKASPLWARCLISVGLLASTSMGGFLTYKTALVIWDMMQYLR